jgi:hypothetical protein
VRGQELGLKQTEMYFGCAQPGSSPHPPWTANISTLIDLGRIFEGVESLEFVSAPSTRQAFRTNMAMIDASNESYTSPITGKTTGPWANDFLRPLIEREAGAAKLALVSEFSSHVVLRMKGGGLFGDEVGKSDFIEVSLPFKQNGSIVIRKFLLGWYVCQMRGVADSIQQPEDRELWNFRLELYTVPIRQALATW